MTKLQQCQAETARLLHLGDSQGAYQCFARAIEASVNLETRELTAEIKASILDIVRQRFPKYEVERQEKYAKWVNRQNKKSATVVPDSLLTILRECVCEEKYNILAKTTLDVRTEAFVNAIAKGNAGDSYSSEQERAQETALDVIKSVLRRAITKQRIMYGWLTSDDLNEIESAAIKKIMGLSADRLTGKMSWTGCLYDPTQSSLDFWVNLKVKGESSKFRDKRFPRVARKDYHDKIRPVEADLEAELGRKPTDGEIAEKAGLTVNRVLEVRSLKARYAPEEFEPDSHGNVEVSEAVETVDAVNSTLAQLKAADTSILKLKTTVIPFREMKFNGLTFKEMTQLSGLFPDQLSGIKTVIQEALEKEKINDSLCEDLTTTWKVAYCDLNDDELLELSKYPRDPATVSKRFQKATDAFITTYKTVYPNLVPRESKKNPTNN